MTTYSSFFSSGLLAAAAPHTVYNNLSNSKHDDVSSSRLNVTDILEDTSDIELDRSTTPTPAANSQPASQAQAQSTQPGPPFLRRRRSSLTVGTSPMNVIKSPTRSAGNALQLQRHRSGSASSVISVGEANVASKSTSLFGRMRSGSIGEVLKSRRSIRRVPGPSCPPPSAPLPPLPPLPALPALPSIPGTPNRSKTKAFSIQVPSSASEALAQKLAATGGEGNGLVLQTNNMFMPASPTSLSPRQPLGDLQLQGHGNGYVNDQDVSMRD